MQKQVLPFGAWEPDKPDYGGEHNMRARNVIPAGEGYRPFPAGLVGNEAVPGKVIGAYSDSTVSGDRFTVAGTLTGLYVRFNAGWVLRSPAIVGGEMWSFARYGNTLFAVNGVDHPLYCTIEHGEITDFAFVEDAPQALYANVIGNFMMLGNLSAYPNAVRWSAIDNPLDWPEPGSNDAQYKQADIQIFPGGGQVQAIATGMSAYEGLIFCETSIYRAQYVGSPYIFQFTAVDKNRGTFAPRSVIQAGNYVYFLSEDGFYATDGAQVKNIGFERVNLWWRDNSDENRRHETMAVYNPVAGVVAWAFASSSCPSDRFDRLMIFHPELNRFSLVYQDVELIYTDASRGLTLEDLDAYGPLDELTFSLDSKGLKGGVAVLGAFNIEHKTVLFAGKAREAALETVEKGGTGMFIHGVRPIIDGAEASVVLLHRNFQKDTLQVLNCAAPSKRDGIAYGRCSTRYARAQVHIPAGVDWTHAQGVEVYYEEEGNI